MNSEAYYYGGVLQRLQEKFNYLPFQAKTPFKVYTNINLITAKFNFLDTNGAVISAKSLTSLKFALLQFLGRNPLGIIYYKKSGVDTIQLCVPNASYGEFNLLENPSLTNLVVPC